MTILAHNRPLKRSLLSAFLSLRASFWDNPLCFTNVDLAYQKVIGKQFTILQTEYAHRSKLYDIFLAKVQEIGKVHFSSLGMIRLPFNSSTAPRAGKATLQTLDEQAQEDVEQLKAELEKKSKVFAKMDKGGKSQDMLLKSLMGGSGRK